MTNFDKIKSFDFVDMLEFLCTGADICEYCKYHKERCWSIRDGCREATSNWLSAEVAENDKKR